MQDLRFTPFNKTSSLARGPLRPGRNESLLMANRASLAHLGQGCELSHDPKGKVLRQLRLNAGLDPCDLATRACISLAQLYEIEKGLTTRFYSNSLREQAAKRVAQLLCTDWQSLTSTGTETDFQTNSNVVQLQWPCASKGASVAASSGPVHGSTEAENQDHPSRQHVQTPLGLSTPCASSVQTVQHQPTQIEQPHQKSRALKVMFWLVLIMLVSVAAAHAINEWSPYRLIWPWDAAFPWRLSLPFGSWSW